MIKDATQLDLFGAVVAQEHQRRRDTLARHRDALMCLRDSVPEALELVAELAYPRPRDSRSIRASGNWAYSVRREGLRFEAVEDWWNTARDRGEPRGWDRAPAHRVSWLELTALLGEDPRRADLAAWVASLPHPRWRQVRRPFELCPDPDTWNPYYLDSDRADEHWPLRRRAWQTVLDLLTDTLGALMAEVAIAQQAPPLT